MRNHKFKTENLKEIEEIESEVKSKLLKIGYGLKFFKLKDMDVLTKLSLVEKGLINYNNINDDNISILVNDEENICIILNDEDHFKIQVFGSGMELENVFNLAREIDEKFNKEFDIAKSKKYGYLTTSPINVGTGLKVMTKLHLPGLVKTGNLRKISQTIDNFGLSFEEVYSSNKEVGIGDFYQVTNKQTLGISEETIINNLKAITDKIIEQERAARKIFGTNLIQIEDIVYRCLGILSNARILKWDEAIKLMSNVKLGVDMGIIKELSDEKISKIYFYINDANLQKYFGQTLEGYDRDIKRAEMIKQIISND